MRRLIRTCGFAVLMLALVALFVGCAERMFSRTIDSLARKSEVSAEKLGDYLSDQQTNMTNLVVECQKLAHDGASQSKDTWTANDPLPPAIKSLSPQYVQLLAGEAATVVDIQTSGGFQHHGYLVVCASKDPNFLPEKGRNWRITRVAPGVFEYRE
jgi:hypothetical protein